MGRVWTPGELVNGGMINAGHGLVNAGIIRAGSLPSNGLLTDLVAYYSLEEASGATATDATGRGNTLSDNSTVGTGTGKVANCRTFVKATPSFLSRASTADLNMGATAFSISVWFNMASTSTEMALVSKFSFPSPSTQMGYILTTVPGSSRIKAYVGRTGNWLELTYNSITQTTGAWYHLVFVHDPVADVGKISWNGAAFVQSGNTFDTINTTADFRLGSVVDLNGSSLPFDGSIDEVGLWKRTLSIGDVGLLYNSGAGLAYSGFS